MDSKKKIAVVTPMYNAERTIEKAMASVDAQTVDATVIHVIVDDHSADDSIDRVSRYMADHGNIHVIKHNIQEGQSMSRNHALGEIFQKEFDYIAFLDADDQWDANHLYLALKHLEETGADMTYSTPRFEGAGGEIVMPFGIPFLQEPTLENIKACNSVYISSVVIRTGAAFHVGTFDPKLDCIEDWDYWVRVLETGHKVALNRIDAPHVTYVSSPDGMAGKVTGQKRLAFMLKHDMPVRLNLGCGDERIPGFLNCDMYEDKADLKFDAKKLDVPDNSVDSIRAYHLIEHFTFNTAFGVLREWYRALKPGGELTLETPDLLNTCKKFVESDEQTRIVLYGHFFAWPDISPGQVHYFLYTETQMRWTLEQCGFAGIQRLAPDSTYAKANPQWPELYLKMNAFKPYKS